MDYFDDLSFRAASPNPEQDASSEIPLNDFTFDVTSMFTNDTEISFNESKVNEDANDFTFDVSSIFAKNSPEKSKTDPDKTSPSCNQNIIDKTLYTDDQQNFEPEIILDDDFAIGHNEEVDDENEEIQTDEDDDPYKKKRSQMYSKELRTLNFNIQNKHIIATAAHLCQLNCEPYIASAAVNEHFQWMEDKPIIKQLTVDEVYNFYNSKKPPAHSLEGGKVVNRRVTRQMKRSCPKKEDEEDSDVELSSEFARVLLNEVILNAEDRDDLSSRQINEVTSNTSKMVQKIFKNLLINTEMKKLKKHRKIRGIPTSRYVCVSSFSDKKTEKDFRGELIHNDPVWPPHSVKRRCYEKEYAINTQVDTLGKKQLKKWYYSRNKLVKDLR